MEIIKTAKGKDAVIHNKFYYTLYHSLKKSDYFKCREPNCSAAISLTKETRTILVLKEIHSHDPLSQVTIDMKIGLNEIKQKIIIDYELLD